MLKSAYNKQNPNLVFEIEKVDRESLGATGIKEVYVGTLVDTSTDPATVKENYKVQTQGFESDWVSTPGTMGVRGGGGSGSEAPTYVIDLGNSDLTKDGAYALSQEALTIIANASAEIQAGKVPNIYAKNKGAYFKAITVEAQISAGDLMFHVIPIGPNESLSKAKNVYVFYQTPDEQIEWEVA